MTVLRTPLELDLIKAGVKLAKNHFGATHVFEDKDISSDIQYQPHISFRVKHKIFAFEIAEYPYPDILQLRHASIVNSGQTITVYSLCPEAALADARGRKEEKELVNHGYGLIILGTDGKASIEQPAIPLNQHISPADLSVMFTEIPKPVRPTLAETFETYKVNTRLGVAGVCEQVEAGVVKITNCAVKKGWVGDPIKSLPIAKQLDALMRLHQCRDVVASLAEARGIIKFVRNPSHHPPNNSEATKLDAKYRHMYIAGVQCVGHLAEAVKELK